MPCGDGRLEQSTYKPTERPHVRPLEGIRATDALGPRTTSQQHPILSPLVFSKVTLINSK